MGWGVVQSDANQFPPGTVNLTKKPEGEETLADQLGLKKRGNVILQPQPSNSPNDPLNWSQTFKIAHVGVLAFLSAAAGVVPVMIQPGLTILADDFKVSPDTISSFAIGALAFWTGVASFVVVSASVVWGKRPLYVTSALVLTVAHFVAYQAPDNFALFIAMRTIAGLASAPGFSLLTATIADIFFVHERGLYIAIWNICLGSGGLIGQIICGFIIEDLGIPAVFGFAAIVFALLTVASYFLALESDYDRTNPKTTDSDAKSIDLDDDEDLKSSKEFEVNKTYGQQLALWTGRRSEQSFWLGMVKPFGLIIFPAVSYGVFAFSLSFAFLVGVPLLSSLVFAEAPYSLSPSQIGLTNLPLVVVSIVGGLSTGWFSDVAGNYMARTNRSQPGVFEPEFRLLLLVIAGPITTVGLIGTGMSLAQTLPLAWVLVWMSVFSFGALFTVQIILTYMVDCFPDQSGQAFSTINLISSIVIFVASGVLITWYETSGAMLVFGSLAAGSIILLVATIPVYVFGKRMRAHMAGLEWAQKALKC